MNAPDGGVGSSGWLGSSLDCVITKDDALRFLRRNRQPIAGGSLALDEEDKGSGFIFGLKDGQKMSHLIPNSPKSFLSSVGKRDHLLFVITITSRSPTEGDKSFTYRVTSAYEFFRLAIQILFHRCRVYFLPNVTDEPRRAKNSGGKSP